VAPANDDVATVKRVAVVAEIAALEFKFEVDALPTLRSDLALGFTVREAGLMILHVTAGGSGVKRRESLRYRSR
jgi:hypothetical protein